ncbi:MAG: glycosyltransferase [Desulfobulbaceae bacterium]|jgi:glycosyltransferase involved in cell wall biosynthesis|nr:glycosyltransferase [Desulfobulbaceae bacterium]
MLNPNEISERILCRLVQGRTCLFISTKESAYIRNSQETRLLNQYAASLVVCASSSRSYPRRLLHVYSWLLTHSLKAYDVIFVGFAPQLALPLFWRKMRDKTVIIDFFISLYDTFVCDRKRFGPGGLVARFLKWLDQSTLRRADYVVCDSKAHAEYFIEELGLKSKKRIILYLRADTAIYHSGVAAARRGRATKVLYFGSILPLQGIDIVIQAIQLLSDRSDLEFTLIGPLPKRQKRALTALAGVTAFDWLSQPELAREIAGADLCLAGHFSAEIAKARRTIPGKAYIYQAMGKPMILGDCPANRELFSQDEKTIFVSQGDGRELARAIGEFAANRNNPNQDK